MPKGDTHQKSHKKSGKASVVKNDFVVPEKDEQIVKINKNVGSSPVTFTIKSIDKDEELPYKCIAMGSFICGPRKEIIREGMYVLIFNQFNKWYIKNIYSEQDIKQLKKLNLLSVKSIFEDEEDDFEKDDKIDLDEI